MLLLNRQYFIVQYSKLYIGYLLFQCFYRLLGGRGHTLTRYFESGCYAGTMAAFNPLIPSDRVVPVPYRVFTTSDVFLQSGRFNLMLQSSRFNLMLQSGRFNLMLQYGRLI